MDAPLKSHKLFPLGVLFVCFVLGCLFAFQAYARQVTCPRCGGTGMIPGPVINGIPSYYGCPNCGGSGGGGSPGVKGRGWIEVPDTPQQNNQPADNSIQQAQQEQSRQEQARRDAEAAKAAEAARLLKQQQFEKAKQDALSSMKGISENEFGLKGVSAGDDLGLKGVDDTKTLFNKGTLYSAPVDTRVKGPSKLDANVPTGLPKSVEDSIPHTPAGDLVRKGFEAVQAHDWKVALAWFQDALNHEPGDPGLQRLVDLAQYTLQRESQTTIAAPVGQDAGEANRALEDYNQNYFSKHPELKQDNTSTSDGEFLKKEDPAWTQFFRYVTSKLPQQQTPAVPVHIDASGPRG